MAGEAVKVPFIEAAAPSTPAASRVVIYAKTDGLMYSKDDAGAETLMSAGASSTLTVENEGTPLATAATTLDFVGAGVTATGGGAEKTITIPTPMAVISDTTLGSDTTFDLTSIPGTYTHLRLVCLLRSARAGNNSDTTIFRFNNDSGSNYDSEYVFGSASTAFAAESVGATSLLMGAIVPAATSTADNAAIVTVDIPFYAGTTFDKYASIASAVTIEEATGGVRTWQSAGHWRSTAAITRITILTATASNFITGSRVILYGIT